MQVTGFAGLTIWRKVALTPRLEADAPEDFICARNLDVKSLTVCVTTSDKHQRAPQFCQIQKMPFEVKAAPWSLGVRSMNFIAWKFLLALAVSPLPYVQWA